MQPLWRFHRCRMQVFTFGNQCDGVRDQWMGCFKCGTAASWAPSASAILDRSFAEPSLQLRDCDILLFHSELPLRLLILDPISRREERFLVARCGVLLGNVCWGWGRESLGNTLRLGICSEIGHGFCADIAVGKPRFIICF